MNDDLYLFCLEYNLFNDLKFNLSIIKNNFSSIADLNYCVEQDPEFDDTYIVVELGVNGEAKQVFNEYKSYTKEYIKNIDNELIRTLIYIID